MTQSTPTHSQKTLGQSDLLVSYQSLRNFIGFSGVLLPVLLLIFAKRAKDDQFIQGSISDYYYTTAGDIFVIVICILAAFLLTYKGDEKLEKFLLFMASVCGFGLTLFPTKFKETLSVAGTHVQHLDVAKLFGKVELHWVFAGSFFICLSLISIFYFTKSNTQKKVLETKDGKRYTQKSRRNIIYIAMGCIMILSIACIGIYSASATVKSWFGDAPMIFILETIAVEAFGVSWITKGETLFPDGQHYAIKGLKQITGK